MTAIAVADEQLGQYARREADLLRRLRDGSIPFDRTMDGLQALVEGRFVLPSVVEPSDLQERFKRQVDRLVEIDAHKQIKPKVLADEYRHQCQEAIQAFAWSRPLARIYFVDVALVDFRLRNAFVAEAGKVYPYYDPDACPNYDGLTTSDCLAVIQYQSGQKYQDEKPLWCRNNFHPLEQGLTVKEGLYAYLYEGKPMLDRCFPDLPGSVSPSGGVPCLRWDVGRVRLSSHADGYAIPFYGSASRGS